MADRDDLEFTTTKRARLSSENSFDQKDSSIGEADKYDPQVGSISRLNATGQGDNIEKLSSEVTSREQHVGHIGHERLESEDFPTCFSVEDDLDNLDEHHYQPIAGPMGWIQRQMSLAVNPEDILTYMVPHAQLPPTLDKATLWKIIIDILTEPTPRQKLDHINSLDDVVELLRGSKNIIVLTGAGVSVSCGIPDFRSRDGIYAKLNVEYPDLPDPQAMFDISYFYQNPRPFFKFAK
ncbi:NAD-dependent protein deacetylase sirtuin-1, partial [Desmophyllum pertusum]